MRTQCVTMMYVVIVLCLSLSQAEHNLQNLSKSSYWRYEQARINFWHRCNSSFEVDKVDPEPAAEFFEVCS